MAPQKSPADRVNEWAAFAFRSHQASRLKWLEDLNFYLGDKNTHWRGRMDAWISDTIENYTFSMPQQAYALMTDRRPQIYCVPAQMGDEVHADIVKTAYETWQSRTNATQAVEAAALDFVVVGMGVTKQIWDHGKQETFQERVSPFSILLDPGATAYMPYDGEFIVEMQYLPIRRIKQLYGSAAKNVRPTGPLGDYMEMFGSKPSLKMVTPVAVGSGTATFASGDTDTALPGSTGNDDPIPRALVLTCYYWDDATERVITEQESVDAFGMPVMEPVEEEVKKYPSGRVTVVSGSTVLFDGPNSYSKFPYTIYENHRVDNRTIDTLPFGEVRQLKPIQVLINKRQSQISHNASLMANPQWLVPEGSIRKGERIRNEPGANIPHKPGLAPSQTQPSPLPGYVREQLNDCKMAVERVSGIPAVAQGMKESGVTAGVAIQSLQDAAIARIRAMARPFERGLKDAATQIIWNIINFYPPDRIIRIAAPGGDYAFVAMQQVQEAVATMSPGSDIVPFDVLVESGSTLPRDPAAEAQTAMNLLGMFPPQQPLISPETALRMLGISNPSAELRVALARAQQAMPQMPMQGGMPGDPGASMMGQEEDQWSQEAPPFAG